VLLSWPVPIILPKKLLLSKVGSEKGTLCAVGAGQGSRLWTLNVARPISIASGVWQNKIFAASKDHSLYAINMDDGIEQRAESFGKQ
jgi:hypothetical protein